jgi:glycosyltransferase involved in cell wall biosynthesis
VAFGTDIKKFKPSQIVKDDSSTTIISTRTLNPVHCVEDLVYLIPEILKLRSNLNFIIVGGGSQFDDLKSFIENQGCLDSVKFTGMIDEVSLTRYLQSADIYVSTSPLDAGLAASTAEAMACGLPVIHPKVADNSKWSDDRGGKLYSANNSSQLKNALLELIDHPELRTEMGKVNVQTIATRNNLDLNMHQMEALYKKLTHHSNK